MGNFKRYLITSLFAFVFSCVTLTAQEIDFSGNLTAQAGVGLPNTHENSGKFLLGTTVFDGVLKSYIGDSMMYANGQFIFDALAAQSSNGTESLVSEDNHFALKLKEAYFDYNGGWWALRAGRQISAWGKADDIQITDILCPQDCSNIIAADYKESRLGIDAIRLSLMQNSVQADAYWIPFFTPSTLPLGKGNPLKSIVFPSEHDNVEMYFTGEPELNILNGEFAARVSTYFSAFDLSFYAFYGWDDEPFSRFDEDGGKTYLFQEYKRMGMIGVDAAIPVDAFVLRLEGAFFPFRYIQTNTDYQFYLLSNGIKPEGAKAHHQAIALAGFDWDAGNGFTVTAQYVADIVFGSDASIDELDRYRYQHEATLSIEKTLLNESLTLSAAGALDLCEFSSSVELSVDYSLSDSIKISLIGDLFLEGPDNKEGLFGKYHDLSGLTLKGKISF